MAAVMGGLKRKTGSTDKEEERVQGDEVDGCAVKRVKLAEDKPQSSSPAPADKSDFTYMGIALWLTTQTFSSFYLWLFFFLSCITHLQPLLASCFKGERRQVRSNLHSSGSSGRVLGAAKKLPKKQNGASCTKL